MTAPTTSGHLAYLDALRGYAIAGVFLAHSFHDFEIDCPRLMPALRSGVTLFYVLSAYCLMLSMHRQKTESNNWRGYCIKRFFRIAPLFYFSVIIWSIIRLNSGHALDPLKIITSLTFTNGLIPSHIHSAVPHGWSIAVETSFYAILPALFLTLTTLRRSLVCLTVILPSSLLTSWLLPRILLEASNQHVDIREYTLYWLPAQLPAFLVGICAFHVIYGKCKLSNLSRRLFETRWLPWIGIGIMLGVTCISPARLTIVPASAAAGCLVLSLSLRARSFLINPVAVRIGLISFSLYLFHQLGINMIKLVQVRLDYEPTATISIIFAAIISILIASLTYRFIEFPGILLGSKLAKKD